MGLLDDLKKQADALKANEVDKTESLRASAVAVDHSLRRSFLYLNDLGKQLNVVQMPSSFKFDLPTVGVIEGLTIKDFFCDFRSKHFIDKDYYGEVQVAYRCWSDRVLTVKKGPDEMEKFRNVLWQNNIEHTSEQFRDQRKVITHEVFKVKCDFRVQARIEGNHETSRLKITTKNVGGFDVGMFNLMAVEGNDKAIEEFAKYFIGRHNEWIEVTKRSVLNPKSNTVPVRTQPRVEPQYVQAPQAAAKPGMGTNPKGAANPKAQPAEDEEEQKKGLFGAIKSILNKPL